MLPRQYVRRMGPQKSVPTMTSFVIVTHDAEVHFKHCQIPERLTRKLPHIHGLSLALTPREPNTPRLPHPTLASLTSLTR